MFYNCDKLGRKIIFLNNFFENISIVLICIQNETPKSKMEPEPQNEDERVCHCKVIASIRDNKINKIKSLII